MIAKKIREYIMIGKGASFVKEYSSREVPSFPLVFVFMAYFRIIVAADKGIDITEIISDTIFAGIILIIWISQLTHPLRLMRMYYLCPKDRAEREADIRGAYLFRSIMHSILIVFMCADIYMLQRANIWSIGYMFITGVMFAFLSRVKSHKYLLNLYVIPALTFSSYLQFALPAQGLEKGDVIFLICSYAFLVIAVLPAYIKLLKAVDTEIKEAAICEEAGADA